MKVIKFPSEKEAIEYCKENNINPRKIRIGVGEYYIVCDSEVQYV